jgi:hypothetical protein
MFSTLWRCTMKRLNSVLCLFVVGLGTCLLSVAPASAAISSALNAFASGQNILQDVSADQLINMAGGATTVDVGDILVSSFAFNSITNSKYVAPQAIGTGSSLYGELSGVLAIKILTKGGSAGAYSWTFGPATSTPDISAIATAGYTNLTAEMALWNSGAMAAFYSDMTPDYSRNGSNVNADFATAVDGTKVWELGFTGLGGAATGAEGWAAYAPTDDIAVLSGGYYPDPGGNVKFAINVTNPIYGSTFLNQVLPSTFGSGFVALRGSASLQGTVGIDDPTAWQLFDAAIVTVNAVPEPSTFVVWALLGGASWLGMRVWRRRGGPVGRQPWSNENRAAIREIIARGAPR